MSWQLGRLSRVGTGCPSRAGSRRPGRRARGCRPAVPLGSSCLSPAHPPTRTRHTHTHPAAPSTHSCQPRCLLALARMPSPTLSCHVRRSLRPAAASHHDAAREPQMAATAKQQLRPQTIAANGSDLRHVFSRPDYAQPLPSLLAFRTGSRVGSAHALHCVLA